jgi:CheY-like chemotaxis protein
MRPEAGTILIVDDDSGMLDTLSDVLAATGYDTSIAPSGQVALAKAQESRFDLILMDIQMPGVNGVQTLHALRALIPTIPVIMMTAYTRDELVADAEQTTGFEVLSKPLDLDHVLGLVRRIVSPGKGGEITSE